MTEATLVSLLGENYGLGKKEIEDRGGYWRIKTGQGIYWLCEYGGDKQVLDRVCQWQEVLREKGMVCFPTLLPTLEGSNYLSRGEKNYYLTEEVTGIPFAPLQEDSLRKVVLLLAQIHAHMRGFSVSEKSKVGQDDLIPGAVVYQRQLTEILFFYRYLSTQRLKNDYERLFVESFESIYAQGQEAVQKMALASSLSPEKTRSTFLLVNFKPDNLVETTQGMVVREIAPGYRGDLVQDFIYFLRMYLPGQQWDFALAKMLLTQYQEKVVLGPGEKLLLLAQLSFPGRYCYYAREYFSGKGKIPLWGTQLERFLYEWSCEDRFLSELSQWLLGE